jgi:FxsC-like protein
MTRNQTASAPYFFLSYARSDPLAGNPSGDPSVEPDQFVRKFFDDLTAAVQQHAVRRAAPVLGFFDQAFPPGSDWKQLLAQALGATQVFIPLYSVGYLTNSWPGREFACFWQRLENSGFANPVQRVVPVLWAPLSGVTDPPGLRQALASPSAQPAYRVNGMRALLKLRPYRHVYEIMVDRLGRQIAELAENAPMDPVDPSQIPDIEKVESRFGAPLSSFLIEVAAPETPGQWRPFPGQELALAEYARHVVERFNFAPDVAALRPIGEPGEGLPGIIIIDPEYIADPDRRAALASVARKLPAWMLPLVVIGQPGDARSRKLAAEVKEMLTKAKPLPTEQARRGAHGVKSLDEFDSVLPSLVSQAERQYIRYRSNLVPSPPPAGRRASRAPDEPTETTDS